MTTESERIFEINVHFKLKGNVSDMVEVERIENYINDIIMKNCEIIYFHGEYYGNYDKQMVLEKLGDIEIEVK